MTFREHQSGNAILMALFVALILIALLAVQIVATRSNIFVAGQRTANAQMNAQTIFSSTVAQQSLMSTLPNLATQTLNYSNLSSGTGLQALSNALVSYLPCTTGSGVEQTLFIADKNACGRSNPHPVAAIASPGLNFTNWSIPLILQTTATLPDGSRHTKTNTGTLYLSSSTSLSVTAFEVLAQNVTSAVPGGMIFDGPFHANAVVPLDAQRSAFPGGFSNQANMMRVGAGYTVIANFQPTPGAPCDQGSIACPLFGGGIGLGITGFDLPGSPNAAAGLNLPANVSQLILFSTPDNQGTGFYACNLSQCDVYQLENNQLTRILSNTAIPPRSGQQTAPVPAENTALGSVTNAIIQAPGAIEVRALSPATAAYAGTLTVRAVGSILIGSSLLAASPVCTSFPNLDASGVIAPANCTNISSTDALGLMSTTGNIQIGQTTYPLNSGDQTLNLQASLYAPTGKISVSDTRLTNINWVGSAAANQFAPDRRIQLAFDPRGLHLPGFPTLTSTITPVRLQLATDQGQE